LQIAKKFKSEPQNIEQGIMNAEGENHFNFIIRNTLFDIRYSLSSVVSAIRLWSIFTLRGIVGN